MLGGRTRIKHVRESKRKKEKTLSRGEKKKLINDTMAVGAWKACHRIIYTGKKDGKDRQRPVWAMG